MYDNSKPFCYCVFLGVQVSLVAMCTKPETHTVLIRAFDFPGGHTIDAKCPAQFEGPECQQTKTTVSNGNGYACSPYKAMLREPPLAGVHTEMADACCSNSRTPLSSFSRGSQEDFMAIGNLHTSLNTGREARARRVLWMRRHNTRFSFYIILSYHKLNLWHIFYHLPVGYT